MNQVTTIQIAKENDPEDQPMCNLCDGDMIGTAYRFGGHTYCCMECLREELGSIRLVDKYEDELITI